MMKKWLVLLSTAFLTAPAFSQTLFTYGNNAVDAADFLRAYNKNNAMPVVNKEASMREYLNLFINSRLKIRDAYDRGLDTQASVKNEIQSFRAQIIDNYMTDPDILKRLTAEAFTRSQKDIHLAVIFISYKNRLGIPDTAAAKQKLDAVQARLKKGEDFLKVAAELSEDPAAKSNKGDLGYITVFSLPYEIENTAYSTPVGKLSAVLPSQTGYLLFKNLGERKAAGKMKVQQILLAFPPNATDEQKKQVSKQADSLYKRLQAGDAFSKLASAFSNDYVSGVNGGILPEISIGQYDPVFEKNVWSLQKDGAFTKPFLTAHGWHIIKRISAKPVVTKAGDKENENELSQKITTDGRWKRSREYVYGQVRKTPGIHTGNWQRTDLWAYSDSVLDSKLSGKPNPLHGDDLLYTIGELGYRVSDWITWCQTFRFKPDGSGVRPYEDLIRDYENQLLYNYYHDHLESYNAEFKNQMAEFAEGNLIFEVMQQEIWNRDQADTAALRELFESNRAKYIWRPSADAVIFFCSDKNISATVLDELKKNPAAWRSVTERYSEKVIADSARYEWSQLPGTPQTAPAAGSYTAIQVNENDNTASFAWVIKVYPQPAQRSFSEARGQVVNDYQQVLEQQMIDELKKKYPVRVNEDVLKSIVK